MNRIQLISKYIEYFKSKGHKEIPNSSLIPDNDPTVLFTTAGMHPLIPYLTKERHPLGKRLVNVQKCIRTQDIDEVGDSYHHTFFEMLGNWSLGDYWKKQAIDYSFEFLTKVLNLPVNKLAVSCFKGDKKVPKDDESAEIWKSLGIPQEKIVFLGRENNWWGPAGNTGPCGSDTEMFYWKSLKSPPKKFDPNDENWIEIWNDVFMEYYKNKKGEFEPADQKNIDTGMGVERTLTALNNYNDNYLADVWQPIIKEIEKISGKSYKGNEKSMRIIADHIKASAFIISDGIIPSNIEQGYVLRRLIRRAVRYGRKIKLKNFTKKIVEPVFNIYKDYELLQINKKKILGELEGEENRFLETLEKGMKVFEKLSENKKEILGKEAFLLYQSYGFPIEMTKELADEKNIKIDELGFLKESEKHQELSRTLSASKFMSGLVDSSMETTRLHTATHLLHAALRKVLGPEVQQKGSNITHERLRFDFSFSRKLTEKEIKEIEDLVNSAINKKLEVSREEMSPSEAKKSGALGFFEHKYGDKVSVYSIGRGKHQFSKEICMGPHVKNTDELGKFKIVKEESSSAGIRRIKAFLE